MKLGNLLMSTARLDEGRSERWPRLFPQVECRGDSGREGGFLLWEPEVPGAPDEPKNWHFSLRAGASLEHLPWERLPWVDRTPGTALVSPQHWGLGPVSCCHFIRQGT